MMARARGLRTGPFVGLLATRTMSNPNKHHQPPLDRAQLREGMALHHGEPFNAQAVQANIARASPAAFDALTW